MESLEPSTCQRLSSPWCVAWLSVTQWTDRVGCSVSSCRGSSGPPARLSSCRGSEGSMQLSSADIFIFNYSSSIWKNIYILYWAYPGYKAFKCRKFKKIKSETTMEADSRHDVLQVTFWARRSHLIYQYITYGSWYIWEAASLRDHSLRNKNARRNIGKQQTILQIIQGLLRTTVAKDEEDFPLETDLFCGCD
jgi:hypothetical protein